MVEALGLRGEPASDPVRALREALRGREVLLVLDNVEHVIDAAMLISDQLSSAAGVRVLATSRERLRVLGERAFDVAPLPVDSTSGVSPAVALFEAVAHAAEAFFRLDSQNLADVTTICRAVDGLPLGIELAAGQVHVLPPALLRARLSSRIDTLSDGLRDRHARQPSPPPACWARSRCSRTA